MIIQVIFILQNKVKSALNDHSVWDASKSSLRIIWMDIIIEKIRLR